MEITQDLVGNELLLKDTWRHLLEATLLKISPSGRYLKIKCGVKEWWVGKWEVELIEVLSRNERAQAKAGRDSQSH